MTGCVSTKNKKPTKEDNKSATASPVPEVKDKENYEAYTGRWSENGASHDQIIANGGSEFSITITDGNQLNGYLYSQQGTSQRIADIDNITGTIENGQCSYKYKDDGFGGSGTLHIQFSDDVITIEVKNYHMDDKNASGFGISGVYHFTKSNPGSEAKKSEPKLSEQELADLVYEKYYAKWPDDKLTAAVEEKAKYRNNCSFYKELEEYMVNVREVGDISYMIEPLFYTEMQYYTKQDFENEPQLIIHLAKNEIYARHGYRFKNKDLYNYFMGQLWYEPSIAPEEFNDNVLNNYEKENLKLLNQLDKEK